MAYFRANTSGGGGEVTVVASEGSTGNTALTISVTANSKQTLFLVIGGYSAQAAARTNCLTINTISGCSSEHVWKKESFDSMSQSCGAVYKLTNCQTNISVSLKAGGSGNVLYREAFIISIN